jgi:hypothetical protein
MSSGIVISTNKRLFEKNDELVIHVWFSRDYPMITTLLIKNPGGENLDLSFLKIKKDITETFAFTCSEMMKENEKYSIIVDCNGEKSEKIFEYYYSGNKFEPSNYI